MKKLLAILAWVLALSACALQAFTPPSLSADTQDGRSPATVTRLRGPSASQTPQASNGRNQPTRTPEPRNPPQRQTPPDNRGSDAAHQGSDAAQSLPLDVPAHPVDVILGRPEQDSITASLLAYQDGEGYIEYGTQADMHPNKTPARALTKGQPAEVVIGALQPDTRYYYQVLYRAGNAGDYAPLEERSFTTPRTPGSTFMFDVQADSHLDSNSSLQVYARTLANELADKPDFLVDLGDTFMTNKYQPHTAAQKQYLAQRYFFGMYAPSPLFLVLGNHDGEGAPQSGAANDMTTWAARLRTQLFPNPVPDKFYTGNPTPDKTTGMLQDYYAWEWGDALFVVLDPYRFTPPARGTGDNWNPTLGAVQYQWLKHTLETSHALYKFVFVHQLVGGLDSKGRGGAEAARYYEWGGNNAEGSYGFGTKRPGWAMPVHQLLVANHVTAVFHGHDHLFVKQDLDGIVYQEVPQPSTARYDATNSAKEYGYVNGDVLGSPGHLRVTVSLSQVKVDYVRSYLPQNENAQRQNGQVDYTYTLTAEP